MAHLPRRYIPSPLFPGQTLELEGQQAHYLARVMRMGPGSLLRVFNPEDGEWEASVQRVCKKSVEIHVTTCLISPQPSRSSPTGSGKLVLLFPPLKLPCLELVVEKATEIGVDALAPCHTAHTHLRPIPWKRLHTIALEATQQSHRLAPPSITPLAPLTHHLDQLDPVTLIWADVPHSQKQKEPRAIREKLQTALSHSRQIGFLVGPEGGWSAAERRMLSDRPHSHCLSLGSTVLRAETAALVGLGIVQWLLNGDR